MRTNVVATQDQGTADVGEWESVEITPIAPIAAIRHPRMTLAAGLLVLGAAIGAGLWPGASARQSIDPGAEVWSAAAAATASGGPGRSADGASETVVPQALPLVEARMPIEILMPARGEVILGSVVVVAGRVNVTGHGRAGATASSVHVVIVVGDAVVGEADLRMVGQRFAGLVPIAEQVRGQVASVRISDGRRPDQMLVEQEVVLGPAR